MIKQKNQSLKKMAWSIEEAAQMIGVSKGHLRNENMRGKIRFIKSGRRVLITDSELRRYVDSLSLFQPTLFHLR